MKCKPVLVLSMHGPPVSLLLQTRGVYITMTASDIDGDEDDDSEVDEEGAREGGEGGEGGKGGGPGGARGKGVAMAVLATDGKQQAGYGALV